MTISLSIICHKVNFNSHPHEEDDWFSYPTCAYNCISTHILTKRMTLTDNVFIPELVFQLTSSRRGWQYSIKILKIEVQFQLTSSRRGWHSKNLWGWLEMRISTHILTKRMTLPQFLHSLPDLYFNSHPHEEDDCVVHLRAFIPTNISTHILTKRMTKNKNGDVQKSNISTHILTKRMTIKQIGGKEMKNISTHILTKRMTGAIKEIVSMMDISTHILTKRMTMWRMGF